MEYQNEKVLLSIDRNELVQSLVEFASIQSPTGSERLAAEFMVQQFKKIGMKPLIQEIESDRANAVGILEGTGDGPSLMFIGHLDTPFPHSGSALGQFLKEYPPAGVVDDKWVIGMGVFNMKQSLAAYLSAVSALVRSGFKPKGDIIIAGVAGEVEKSQVPGVPEYTGSRYRGYGVGAEYLVNHGVVADMALDGEPTNFEICTTVFGVVWLRLRISGKSVHSALRTDEINPVEESSRLINAIKEWGNGYSQRNLHHGVNPPTYVGAIEGGWPWRLSRTPGWCDVYVEVRTNPKQNPLGVVKEIKQLVRGFEKEQPSLEVSLEPYLSIRGSEISPDVTIVKSLARAHKQIFGTDPKYVRSSQMAVHQGNTVPLVTAGIPCVTYGSGTKVEGAPTHGGEYLRIDDLVKQAKVYALLAKDIGSRSE